MFAYAVKLKEESQPSIAFQIINEDSIKNSKIIFICWDECEKRCRTIAESVCLVHNSFCLGLPSEDLDLRPSEEYWIREKSNWEIYGGDCKYELDKGMPEGIEYVYAYVSNIPADPTVFYVGKGVGVRMLAHIREAVSYNSEEKPNELEILKIKKVRELMKIDECEDPLKEIKELEKRSRDSITRMIATFTGDHRTELAMAVENFLINHVYGAISLTNKTRGDHTRRARGSQDFENARWLTRPKYFNEVSWCELLYLQHNKNQPRGRLISKQLNNIIRDELNHKNNSSIIESAVDSIFPARCRVEDSRRVRALTVKNGDLIFEPVRALTVKNGDSIFQSNGQDTFIEVSLQVQTLDNQWLDIFILHFKMGCMDLSVEFNIRPCDGRHDRFERDLEAIFFGGGGTYAIKNFTDPKSLKTYSRSPGSDTYFKPFAPSGKGGGRHSVTFDLLDPNREINVDCKKLNKKPVLKFFDNISKETNISLIDALDILLKSINIDEANVIIRTHHYHLVQRT